MLPLDFSGEAPQEMAILCIQSNGATSTVGGCRLNCQVQEFEGGCPEDSEPVDLAGLYTNRRECFTIEQH